MERKPIPPAMFENQGLIGLVTGATQGHYTLPDELVSAYAEAVEANSVASPDAKKVNDLVAEAMRIYRDLTREFLITAHIQPALADLIEGFREELETLGNYVNADTIPLALLSEPEEMREAYIRFSAVGVPYGAIRAAWAVLRGTHNGFPYGREPLNTGHILAEVSNIPDLVSNWEHCFYGHPTIRGHVTWPWPNGGPQRLAWILNHGGQIWAPTVQQQRENYALYTTSTGVA